MRRTKEGLEYRADAKHRKIILKEMGMDESSNAVVSPLVKEAPGEDGELMDKEMASRYRGLVARANYLAQDRADLQFTTKKRRERWQSRR